MKTIILQTLAPLNDKVLTNWAVRKPFAARRGFLLISLVLVFALCQQVQSAPDRPKQSAADGPKQSAPKTEEQVLITQSAPNTPDPGSQPFGNTADGQGALQSVTTGLYNAAFGTFSLLSVTDGNFCTGVGAGTLLVNTASENTAVGAGALLSNTDTTGNTATGAFALFSNTAIANTANGVRALQNNTTGFRNTAVGEHALIENIDSDFNTATGSLALSNNTTGGSNTAVGVSALLNNITGSFNQAFGRGALRNTTGSNNIGIGSEAGSNQTSGDNVISIGSLGDATVFDANNRCYIGNIRDTVVGNADGINVIVDSDGQLGTANFSSRRFKKDIKPMYQTSEAILALKPITFHYKNLDTKKAENTLQFGLVAEDVAEVNPDLVIRDKAGQVTYVRYDAVNVMLLNEFLKEHKKVEAQQATITELKSTVAQQQKGMDVLTAQLKEQAAQIQKVSAQLEVNKPAAQIVRNGQ